MAKNFAWFGAMWGEVDAGYGRPINGVNYNSSLFACCGLGQLSNMSCGSVKLTTFEDKAAWLAGLYTGTQRGSKQLMFVATNAQLAKDAKPYYHGLHLLIEAGAVLIDTTKNYQPGHSRSVLKTYRYSPRDNVGKFYDANGVPFTEEPKVAIAAVPEKQ